MDTNEKMNTAGMAESANGDIVIASQTAGLARQWQDGMKNATFQGSGQDFWDNWARSLPVKTGSSSYTEEVLNRMEVVDTDSVLDVGAGTGALAVPLAGRVRKVTALDQSRYMLEEILKKAARQNLSNITTVNINWADVQVGCNVEEHDVVLVSRSLPSQESIISSLRSINMAARRSCYITWKADSYDPLESEICRRLNIEYRTFPGYELLCDLICSMGIHASVDTFKISSQRIYRSVGDAFIQIIRSFQFQTLEEKNMVRSLLAENLEYNRGLYMQKKDAVWALISWKK